MNFHETYHKCYLSETQKLANSQKSTSELREAVEKRYKLKVFRKYAGYYAINTGTPVLLGAMTIFAINSIYPNEILMATGMLGLLGGYAILAYSNTRAGGICHKQVNHYLSELNNSSHHDKLWENENNNLDKTTQTTPEIMQKL